MVFKIPALHFPSYWFYIVPRTLVLVCLLQSVLQEKIPETQTRMPQDKATKGDFEYWKTPFCAGNKGHFATPKSSPLSKERVRLELHLQRRRSRRQAARRHVVGCRKGEHTHLGPKCSIAIFVRDVWRHLLFCRVIRVRVCVLTPDFVLWPTRSARQTEKGGRSVAKSRFMASELLRSMTDRSGPPAKRARHGPVGLDARVSSLALPTLSKICSLAVDSDGTVFVGTESALYTISLVGRLSLLAGSEHEKGFCDGQGSQARFNIPRDLAVESDGCLLVADTYNHRLRRVSPHGTVTTVAGSGEPGHVDGVGAAARFHRPRGIAVDAQGVIYVSDHVNHCLRQVFPATGRVTTLCGSCKGEPGFADGPGV
jgi:hypothetical protein